MPTRALFLIPVLILLSDTSDVAPATRSLDSVPAAPVLIDDFEAYAPGSLPTKWKYLDDGNMVPVEPRHMHPTERWWVEQESSGNKVLRGYTHDEVLHLAMLNEAGGMDWDFRTHPRLAWDWRALQLPPGAREDKEELNDTGIGLYVYFSIDGLIFKRPKAIKYAYSSTLPVGTVVSYGKMKVIVASSAVNGTGDWVRINRDVVADYREVFGDDPPDRPLFIRLWNDTDNTGTESTADFDNIRLMPATGR